MCFFGPAAHVQAKKSRKHCLLGPEIHTGKCFLFAAYLTCRFDSIRKNGFPYRQMWAQYIDSLRSYRIELFNGSLGYFLPCRYAATEGVVDNSDRPFDPSIHCVTAAFSPFRALPDRIGRGICSGSESGTLHTATKFVSPHNSMAWSEIEQGSS